APVACCESSPRSAPPPACTGRARGVAARSLRNRTQTLRSRLAPTLADEHQSRVTTATLRQSGAQDGPEGRAGNHHSSLRPSALNIITALLTITHLNCAAHSRHNTVQSPRFHRPVSGYVRKS